MRINTQYTTLAVCILLVMPAIAFADDSAPTSRSTSHTPSSIASALLVRAACQASFETNYVSTVISDVPNIMQATMTADSGKLNSDIQSLTSDVNAGNTKNLKSDLQAFRTDSESISKDVRSAIHAVNVTSVQISKLKSDTNILRNTLQTCTFTVGQQVASAKIQSMNSTIYHMQDRSNKLSAKGIDTTQLNQVISQAQSNLNDLKTATSSANNTKSLRTALQNDCMYNGCKNGDNIHFAAQSALAIAQGKLNAIKSNPNSAQYASQISQAQEDVTNAQNTLGSVGHSQYQNTQKNDVWASLHGANSVTNQLWKEVNGNHHGSSHVITHIPSPTPTPSVGPSSLGANTTP